MINTILTDIMTNLAFVSAILAWFLAQTIKVFLNYSRKKDFNFKWYTIPGGFPSSHSAAVIALCTSLGLKYGFGSGVFAVSAILAAFILYDASVVRKAAGRQAVSLNKIMGQMGGREMEPLKEVLGHSLFEILAGSLIGILVAVLLAL